ncbi:MAG TPA: hypothetical protein VFU22_29225 [Roseiflexaceae bacterium]|nr:hypothetical protein [Roseiflexaceae bacterium]
MTHMGNASKTTIAVDMQIEPGKQGTVMGKHHHGVDVAFWGLCARLYTKLAAHTLCLYLNRLLGNPDRLRIKALAFPNAQA